MLRLAILCILFTLNLSMEAQSYWSMAPCEVRDLINQRIMELEAHTPAVKSVQDLEVVQQGRTTPVRIYTPDAQTSLPIILMIHGGGWIAGNLDTHDHLARYLCRGTNSLVISVGYDNSPEAKFPVPLEQCYDALQWIVANAQQFHANTQSVAVVGDSAGGNMAAALCLLARDRQGPLIHMQVLINPAPDLTLAGTLEQQNSPSDNLIWFAKQYVTDVQDLSHPYASPGCAKDLSRLPPALVLLADQDPLCAIGKKYANQLDAAGVPATTYTQRDSDHLAGRAARATTCAQESLDVAVKALNKMFAEAVR